MTAIKGRVQGTCECRGTRVQCREAQQVLLLSLRLIITDCLRETMVQDTQGALTLMDRKKVCLAVLEEDEGLVNIYN